MPRSSVEGIGIVQGVARLGGRCWFTGGLTILALGSRGRAGKLPKGDCSRRLSAMSADALNSPGGGPRDLGQCGQGPFREPRRQQKVPPRKPGWSGDELGR